MGLRLVAVMTIVVIALAAASVFLATHRVADRVTPADSEHAIVAYKAMVADDYTKITTAGGAWTCTSGSQFAACEADANRMLPLLHQFLNDLNRFQTPTTFAVIDAQMRHHLAVQSSRLDALIAASRAHDAAAADRELAAWNGETGARWSLSIVSGVLRSRPETLAAYMESVRLEKQRLDDCVECRQLSGQNPASCSSSQAPACQVFVDSTARQVASFQATVVTFARPTSLTTKDNRLQVDLGKAETALKAMVDAASAGDEAGFSAGRSSFQQALLAVDRDTADILNA